MSSVLDTAKMVHTELVLSDSAFFAITIVAEVILTIVNSFTIVCLFSNNESVNSIRVGLCGSVLSLHCSIFMEVVILKTEPHVGCTKSILSICKQILHVAYVLYFCSLLVSTNLLSVATMPKQLQTSIIAPSRGCNSLSSFTLGGQRLS